ncbi:MAG: hypothetical protein FWC60_09145 [Firmicutes bacterium]|nr:hypothetical protein [Bacillota bacterium]
MRTSDNTIEREINRIRLEIYEETKNMTPEQRVQHTRKSTDETIKKYGFKLVGAPNDVDKKNSNQERFDPAS